MEVAGLNLLGGANGGGTPSTVGSGGGVGSLSTVSKAEVVEQDYVSGLSAEVSSSELDLGLGLSLGVGGCNGVKTKPCSWGEYGRILTAQDFPSIGCGTSGSSSSSSNSSGKPAISTQKSAVSGTKRAADSITQEGQGTVSQVVGWPPIRTYRINNLVNQSKNPAVDDGKMVVENCKTKDISDKKTGNGNVQKKGQLGTLFVKVNMDGVPIGRKLDLNAHACYETLAETLDDMFFYRPSTTKTTNFIRSNENSEAKKGSKLLGGSSEFVLTYEDKDGDWMLVGDVPWGMFLSTVKRLKIMRTSEANGLTPRFGGSNERPRNRPI